MKKVILVGVALVVLMWSGLRVWSANFLSKAMERKSERERELVQDLRVVLERMPAYKLTFLGAKFLRGGDYELAKTALELATQKDRFYRDAFRYYGYVLQATGDNEKAELAFRRAKSLDPRTGE